MKRLAIVIFAIFLAQNVYASGAADKEKGVEDGLLGVFKEMMSLANKTDLTLAIMNSQSRLGDLFNKTSKDVASYVNTLLTDISTIQKEGSGKPLSTCLQKNSMKIKLLGLETVVALKDCEDIAKEAGKGVEQEVAVAVKEIGKKVFGYAKEFGRCDDLLCKIGCISKASKDGLGVSGANANRVTTSMINSGVKAATCMSNTFKSFMTKFDSIKALVLNCIKK